MGMNKNILIIGAGISGLSLLYFLKRKYAGQPEVKITLLEKEDHPGGNIQTLRENGSLIECGPNGFLANQPATLDLIESLGLSSDLIAADTSAQKRFVLIEGQLHRVPLDPLGLFGFAPMTFSEKLRVLAEPFIPKGKVANEVVYDFAKRRFGVKAARYFMDPMVSGIYAGDSEFLSIEAAFPRLYEFEQRSGSVVWGMINSKNRIKGELKSFRQGMSHLIEALTREAQGMIKFNETVRQVVRANEYYVVVTDRDKYTADELFICTPAHVTGPLLEDLHVDLGRALCSIDYAPLAVATLLFEKAALRASPEGFGYLIPSSEDNPVLGVLIESNVFEGRAPEGHVLLRVMLGGSRNPECTRGSKEELMAIVLKEIDQRYGVEMTPCAQWLTTYARAIPQYEASYLTLKKRIRSGLTTLPKLHLLANYLDGVAVNDCIRNAKQITERIEI